MITGDRRCRAKGGTGRRKRTAEERLKTCALCLLLGLAQLTEFGEARKVVATRITHKPSNVNRGYASPDISRLSYSPSHSAAVPAKPPSAGQPGSPPNVGWNVPNQAPPPYSAYPNHGPPAFGGSSPVGGSSYPGVGGGVAPGVAGGVVAGNAYRPHGHNVSSGFGGGGFAAPPPPNPGYPVQPAQSFPGGAPIGQPIGGGYPAGSAAYPGGYAPGGFPPGGFPQQPGYGQPVHTYSQPAYNQPGTVVHNYEQPSSGGSGIGTILGAGVAGLAAGAGGAALYDALKPKDEPKEAAAAGAADAASTTTTSTTLAPIAPNGEAPLAPLPVNPNGEAVLAPMPQANNEATETNNSTVDGNVTVTENPLGIAPLAAFPVSNENASSSATSTTLAVEAPNSALSVQPNEAGAATPTTAPQQSPEAMGSKASGLYQPHGSLIGLLMLVLPVICKYLTTS